MIEDQRKLLLILPNENTTTIIELAQLSCIWTEVLQIINLMLSCRGVGSPARRAPLRGERSWRRAAAAQKHYFL